MFGIVGRVDLVFGMKERWEVRGEVLVMVELEGYGVDVGRVVVERRFC